MGGHHSKQTVKDSTDLVTNASLNVTQDCMTFMDGKQVIGIYGSGNIFKGNIMTSSLDVDMKCVSQFSQKNKFQNSVNDQISQSLSDQEEALTAWMDPGGDTQSSNIIEKVTDNITFNDVEKCLTQLNGTQLFIVDGDNNVVVDNVENQTLQMAGQCLLGGGQTSNVVDDVTNTTNQHSTYTDPLINLGFIADAIESAIKSVMVIAAIVFIAIIILVIMFEISHHTKAKKLPPVYMTPASLS